MKTMLHVKKEEFPTYFGFTREQIVELMSLTDAPAIEYQDSIRTKLLYELQRLYCERTIDMKYSVIHLYDLVGAFLGCSDVVVEDRK